MPSVSKKQHNLMALVANDPKAAKRLKIPQSVGQDYLKADKGKKFAGGGMALFKGKETKAEEMKEAKAVKSGKLSPAQYAKGEAKEGHGAGAMAKGKALKSGKLSAEKYAAEDGMKKGGCVKKMAGGGYVRAADGITKKGKTKGKII